MQTWNAINTAGRWLGAAHHFIAYALIQNHPAAALWVFAAALIVAVWL
jgi:hypothetical protein